MSYKSKKRCCCFTMNSSARGRRGRRRKTIWPSVAGPCFYFSAMLPNFQDCASFLTTHFQQNRLCMNSKDDQVIYYLNPVYTSYHYGHGNARTRCVCVHALTSVLLDSPNRSALGIHVDLGLIKVLSKWTEISACVSLHTHM